jgi:uncharacterized membrane protein YedE/YeeE
MGRTSVPRVVSNFTPLASLAGGALIGASASALLLLSGRLAGISGIFGGLLLPRPGEVAWRALFFAGLLAGGLLIARLFPGAIEAPRTPWGLTLVGGALVGFGTRLSSGCTSGHGVCGLSRLSLRSLAATLTFMVAGIVTATLVHHVFGGLLGGLLGDANLGGPR